jgi:hypothetical protein
MKLFEKSIQAIAGYTAAMKIGLLSDCRPEIKALVEQRR